MCGIAGILRWQGPPVQKAELTAMIEKIAHRGPDGEGIFVQGPVGLGHRRLAIIDPVTGQQPIFNEDGNVAVTFNGEIYNFKDLREELTNKGHVFKTETDTEVIVHGWEEWGKSCVERFRGMFAFGVVDLKKKVLFLARDHFGIKPLYYSFDSSGVIFASELQAFNKKFRSQTDLDLTALDQYLSLGYILAPQTIFKNILKLEPAHRILFHFDGTKEKPECYWNLKFRPPAWPSLEDCAEELEAILQDSVKVHLVSDVPFGAFLSGGMDSSLVVSLMAKQLRQPVKTFSIGFSNQDYDELKYARQVSRRWNTEHHEEIVEIDALGILPELTRHYGEPFADSSAIPTYYISKLARQHVPMVLSGDGGDEAFGGYKRYQRWMRSIFPERKGVKRIFHPLAAVMIPNRYGLRSVMTLENWKRMVELTPQLIRRKLWRQEHLPDIEESDSCFKKTNCPNFSSPIDFARYLDYQTYLPNDILTKVDIASMAHGLEVRTPLVDLKIVEFATSLPPHFLMDKNLKREWTTKNVIRQILKKYFSEDFINRPKRGFSIPMGEWLSQPDLRERLSETLTHSRTKVATYFDPKTIEEIIAENAREKNKGAILWSLLFLETWLAEVAA